LHLISMGINKLSEALHIEAFAKTWNVTSAE